MSAYIPRNRLLCRTVSMLTKRWCALFNHAECAPRFPPLPYSLTHLLPGPQSIVLLVFALPVRNAVLAHNPAGDCQCRAPWGRATPAAASYPRAVVAPIALSKTYPAIVKSGDLYVAACGGNWWFRGVDVVFESQGRMMHRRNIGSRVPRRLPRLRAATFGHAQA